MERLNALLEAQVRRHLDVSPEELEYLRHPDPAHLHEPLSYKNMQELVLRLHELKKLQEKHPENLLVVHGDYDTDGICAAVILAASLNMFGFKFRIHIPTMEDGYGLTRTSVEKIRERFGKNGNKVHTILTADNGISAFGGVAYAKMLGIRVLVTDHHPSDGDLPDADVVVDANRPGDLYPFKGNSGACVAWKAMLAYANAFERKNRSLIERLIVFAGLSNVADVMPMRNENRYTVTAALAIVKDLLAKGPSETGIRYYDTAFEALYDLVTELQADKDRKRKKKGKKKPVPLPMNEELFSWCLSPLLNAPRRVHDTCLEALSVFLVSDRDIRKRLIGRLLELNETKGIMRDRVLDAVGTPDVLLCANTKKGISGLVAGKLSERTGLPSIVLSRNDPDYPNPVYTDLTMPKDGTLSGSARSNELYPLNELIAEINARIPGLVRGGGHAGAAGITIQAKDYGRVRGLIGEILPAIYARAVAEARVRTVPENALDLYVTENGLIARYQVLDEKGAITYGQVSLAEKTFAADAKEAYAFIESLRPFGEGYMREPAFRLVFDRGIYKHGWNPDFWKTFKCDVYGVEVLTFDGAWANEVKAALAKGAVVTGVGKLRMNEFRGRVTPQIVLEQP